MQHQATTSAEGNGIPCLKTEHNLPIHYVCLPEDYDLSISEILFVFLSYDLFSFQTQMKFSACSELFSFLYKIAYLNLLDIWIYLDD